MELKITEGEDSKVIRIEADIYNRLLRFKAVMEMRQNRSVSFNEALRELLHEEATDQD